MALAMICTCGARFEVDATFAGREILCPECQSKLTVPAAEAPAPRVSVLALLSVILALAGAVTLVGTVVAVLVGLGALVQIARNRTRLTGATYAVTGIVLGLAFTTVTTLVLAGGYLNGLRDRYRDALFADQLDSSGPLARPGRGFVLERPAADWGGARRNKVDDPFVDALRFGQDADLMLVQPARFLFVDVRRETRPRNLTVERLAEQYLHRIEMLRPTAPNQNPGRFINQRWPPIPADRMAPEEDPILVPEIPRGALRPVRVVPRGQRQAAVRDDKDRVIADTSGIETRLDVDLGVTTGSGRTWAMLVRQFRKGDSVYVVRGYAPLANFDKHEAELRQAVESFRLSP